MATGSDETQMGKGPQATSVAILDEDALRGKIHEVRGQKVMLDFELAEIYGYTTKAFNQQVQRNIGKFEGEDFMFVLASDEERAIRSQFVTGSHRNERYPTRAFTEQGTYMLMTVLKGELAVKQSRALIRLFKQMKDAVEEGRGLVGRREFLDLSLRLNDSLSEGLRLRRDLGRVEDDVARVIDEMDGFVRKSEIGPVIEDFGKAVERRIPPEPLTPVISLQRV